MAVQGDTYCLWSVHQHACLWSVHLHQVWAFARRPTVQHGTFIEYVSLPESYVALAPPSLSLEEAAAVPLAALTAYQVGRPRFPVSAPTTCGNVASDHDG